MVRLARAALVLAVSAGLAALTVPACIIGSITVGADCPIDDDGNLLIPRECCICPSPEACPQGWPEDVIVPDYCRPDCPEDIPYQCCPCPSPEWCPSGAPSETAHFYFDIYCPGGWDAGSDGSMSSLCTGGSCETPGPADWKGPMSFWQGWDIEAPSCPGDAPILAFEGWTAPPPPSCGTCKCDAPEGTCKLPETWAVDSQACPGGGVKTNFDPPTNWDGTCNGDKSILGDKLCGGVPCVRSITISPPVIEELPCQTHLIGDPEPKVPKARNGGPEITLGRVCTSESALPNCIEAEGKVCVPKPPSFSACLYREGDHACPEGWGEKTLLYGYVDDKRTCAECECSEPSGGFCNVKFRIFSDAACNIEKEAADVSTGMIAPCKDLMAGTQLSGKSAAILEYTKGACTPSGGDAEGELVLLEPVTVCCSTPDT